MQNSTAPSTKPKTNPISYLPPPKNSSIFLRFPLGAQDKSVTREMAVELGLNVASKPDSQDICFVPTGKYTDVIKKLRPDAADPGEVLHVDGRVLGTHEGIMHYTIGQRRGLGIPDGSGQDPLYVSAPRRR